MTSERRALSIATPELLVLTLLAAATRFWRLFTPRAVVFDEVWSETYAGHYLAHTFYVDVHPPLAKLLMAATARLFGIDASILLQPLPAVELRVLPALLGTLIIPLVYVILRRVDASRPVAALGAALVLLDNALLVESRLLLPESFLICFGLSAVALFLGARHARGGGRWALLAAAAFAAGCALSVKWTGASALGLILATWFVDALMTRIPVDRIIAEGLVLVGIPIVVYVAAFAVHFALLTRSGGTFDAAMSRSFQATLIGNPSYDPRVHVSFLAKFAEMHRVMMAENASFIGATHAGSSPWYTWPIMKHPISYWVGDITHPSWGVLILLGNPLVWWGSLIASGAGWVLFVRRRAQWAGREFALLFLTGGYLLNFAPFAGIQRLMFLYHYLFALTFIAMLGALSLGAIAGWSGNEGDRFAFASRKAAATYWCVLAAAAVSFLYFSPFSYAIPMSPASLDFHFWVLHPRF